MVVLPPSGDSVGHLPNLTEVIIIPDTKWWRWPLMLTSSGECGRQCRHLAVEMVGNADIWRWRWSLMLTSTGGDGR